MHKLPINNLGDLKNMTNEELKLLAQDIRKHIIDTVSKTGGHLSSNLGIVELTIALHILLTRQILAQKHQSLTNMFQHR